LSRSYRYAVQQMRHEKYLRGQRRAMSQMLNSLGKIFWIYDIQNQKFFDVDKGIKLITGSSYTEHLKDPGLWAQQILEEDRSAREEIFSGNVPKDNQQELKYRMLDHLGRMRTLLERVIRQTGPSGEDWLIGVTRDITEEQKNQGQLRMLQRVVEQIEEAIVVTDNHLDSPGGPKIVYVNQAFCNMTGYTQDEILGKTPRILQGPNTEKDVINTLRKNLEDGEDFEGETINYRKDGEEYWLRWGITPVLDRSGQVEYYASIQRDITEEKQRQDLDARNQRLRSLGNLVGGVAHDLNNILSPILMTAGLLEMESTNETIQRHAETLTTSSKRASDIVSKLLTFSRGGTSERILTDISEVLNEVYTIGKETFPSNIKILQQIPEDLWPAECSATEIQQVLLNLTINAKDSMKREGGTLTLCLENQTLDEIQSRLLIGEAKPGPHVCIHVSDEGHGIPENEINEIFDPFHTTKDQGDGTGLGLASALGIIRSHGGGIQVLSKVGEGSTFRVYLPAEADTVLLKTERSQPKQKGAGQHLLVVDDESLIVETVCKILEGNGYQAQGLTSPVEALKRFSSDPSSIDGLLTDLMMPEIDGAALTKTCRELKPDLPVLIMSGYAHHDILDQVKTVGEHEFVQKPVRVAKLLESVYTLLNSGS